MDELALPRPKLPINLSYCLCLKTPTDQFVELGDQRLQFLDIFSLIQDIPACLEASDIRHLSGGQDHLLGSPLADLRRLGEIRCDGRCNALDGSIASLAEFIGGGWPYSR